MDKFLKRLIKDIKEKCVMGECINLYYISNVKTNKYDILDMDKVIHKDYKKGIFLVSFNQNIKNIKILEKEAELKVSNVNENYLTNINKLKLMSNKRLFINTSSVLLYSDFINKLNDEDKESLINEIINNLK